MKDVSLNNADLFFAKMGLKLLKTEQIRYFVDLPIWRPRPSPLAADKEIKLNAQLVLRFDEKNEKYSAELSWNSASFNVV